MGATGKTAPQSRISHSIRYVLESLERRALLTAVSWDAGGNGTSWTDPLNWSTNQIPGAADDVTISAEGELQISLSSGTRTVHSLVCDEELTVSGSSTVLVVLTTAQLSNTLQLESLGTLQGGTWSTTDAGVIRAQFDAQLNGITLDGQMIIDDTYVRVLNSLTINGNISINEFSESAILAFEGNQLLSGTGTITFDSAESLLPVVSPANFGDVLTIGAGVTIQAGFSAGQVGNVDGSQIINYGTISAQSDNNQPVLISSQPFTNYGTLAASTATITSSDALTWSGGSITGPGTTIAAAGASITGNVTKSGAGAFRVYGALTIGGGTALDVTDGALIVQDTPTSPTGAWAGSAYTGLAGKIQTGRNGGAWNGNGIRTSAAAGLVHTVGIAKASEAAPGGIFAGQSVTGSDTIIRYTLAGDADLDGVIDGDDFYQIDNHVGLVGGAVSYFNGDFDFNGRVDADDYWLIDSNYNEPPPESAPVTAAVTAAAPTAGSELPAMTDATPQADTDQLLAELR